MEIEVIDDADDEVLQVILQHILDELVANEVTEVLQQRDSDELLVAVEQLEIDDEVFILLDEIDEMELQTLYQVHL